MQVDTFGHLKMTPRKDASDFLLGLSKSQYGTRQEAFPSGSASRLSTSVSHAGEEELDSIQVLSLQRGLRAKFRQVLSENRNLVATVNSYIRQAELVISRFDTRRVTTAESYEEVLDKLDVCHDSCVSLSRLAERLFERSFVEEASSSEVVQNFSFNKDDPASLRRRDPSPWQPKSRDPSPWPAQSPGVPEYESPLRTGTSPGKPVRESSLKKEINNILKESPCKQKSGSRKRCTCVPSPHLSSSSDSTLSSKQTEVRLKALEKRFNSVIYSQFSDVTKEGVKPVLSENSKFKEHKNTSPGCGLCEIATSPNKYVEPSLPATKESGVQVEDLVDTAKGTHSKLSLFRSQTPPFCKSYNGDDSQNMPLSTKSENHCYDDTMQKSFSCTQKHSDRLVPNEVKNGEQNQTIDPVDLALMQELLQNFKELKSDKERTHRINVQETVSAQDHSKTSVGEDVITQSQMKEVIGELRAALKEVGTPKVTTNQPSTSRSSFTSLDQLKAVCGLKDDNVELMQLPNTDESDNITSSVKSKIIPLVFSKTNENQQDFSKDDQLYKRVTHSEIYGNIYSEGEHIDAVESSNEKVEHPKYKEYEDTLEQSYLLNSALVKNEYTYQTQMNPEKLGISRPIALENEVSEKKTAKKALQNYKLDDRRHKEKQSPLPLVKDEYSSKNNTPRYIHNVDQSCTRQTQRKLSTCFIKDSETPQTPIHRGKTPDRNRTQTLSEVFYGGDQYFTAASSSSIQPKSDPTGGDLPEGCLSSNSVSHEFLETNKRKTKRGARNRYSTCQPEYQLKRNSKRRSSESGSREKVEVCSGDFISHTHKDSLNIKRTARSTLSSSCRGDERDINISQRSSGDQQDYFVDVLSEKIFNPGDVDGDVGELNTISDANVTCRNRAVRFHCINVSGKGCIDKGPCESKHRSHSNYNKQKNNKGKLFSDDEDMTSRDSCIENDSNHVKSKHTVDFRKSSTYNKIAYSQKKSNASCVAFETSPGISLLDSQTYNEDSDGFHYQSESSCDEDGSSPEHTYRCFNVEVPTTKGDGDTRFPRTHIHSSKLSSSKVLPRNMKRQKHSVQEPESHQTYEHSFGDINTCVKTSPSSFCGITDDQLSENVDGEDSLRKVSYDNFTFGIKRRPEVKVNKEGNMFFKRNEQRDIDDPPCHDNEQKCLKSNQHTLQTSVDLNPKLKKFGSEVSSLSTNGYDTYEAKKFNKLSYKRGEEQENISDTLNMYSPKSRCLMKTSSDSHYSVPTPPNKLFKIKEAHTIIPHSQTSETPETTIIKGGKSLSQMKELARPKYYEQMFKAKLREKPNKKQTQNVKVCSLNVHHMIDKRKSLSRKRLDTELERKVRALDQIANNTTQGASIENETLYSNFLSNANLICNSNDDIEQNNAPSSQSPFKIASSKNNIKHISLPSAADISDDFAISPKKGRDKNDLMLPDQVYINNKTNNVRTTFDNCQLNFEKQQICVSSFIKDIKEERRYYDLVDFIGQNNVLDLSRNKQEPTHDITKTVSMTSRNPKEGTSSESTKNTSKPINTNNMMVRITNLPLDVPELAMLQLARSKGHVVKIYFIKHKRTAEFQGVAYVRYESLASATNAARDLHGVTFQGAVLGAGLQEEDALPGTPMGRPGELPDTPTPKYNGEEHFL